MRFINGCFPHLFQHAGHQEERQEHFFAVSCHDNSLLLQVKVGDPRGKLDLTGSFKSGMIFLADRVMLIESSVSGPQPAELPLDGWFFFTLVVLQDHWE